MLFARYLAPEVCRGKVFPASDVWAVGILTAYLLTGSYPFIDKISPSMPSMQRTLRYNLVAYAGGENMFC